MPKVKVNDIQMYYETRGEGFPLLMIVGFLGNADCWDPRMMLGLSDRFKTVVFDNRGAGRTDLSDREYSIKLFADDTAGLMDALGIPRAHVLGISMGGMIAQELVLNHPQKVEKLILASTSCGGTKSVPISHEAVQNFIDLSQTLAAKGSWDPEIARKLIPNLFTEDFIKGNPGAVDAAIRLILTAPTPSEALMRQVNAILEFDACDRLSQIRAPTLILAGKRDVTMPPENASILASSIPGSKLVYFKNSAHTLIEETEEVLSTILEFLGS